MKKVFISIAIAAIFLVFALFGCTRFASSVSNKIYPALQKPYENEAPPTPSTFPASSEISAVIGGKGEGLSCSLPLPSLTGFLFFSDQDKAREAPISLQFRQACAFHDFCYRHGAATYGYQQVDCDFMLQDYAYRLCRQIFWKEGPGVEDCMSRARRVLLGVRIGGGTPFQAEGRSTYFEFDPMPSRAFNYTVSRLITLAKELDVTGNNGKNGRLRQSVVSYNIKRGTVVPRLLTWTPCPPLEKPEDSTDCMLWSGANTKYSKPFPKRAIATPPRVVKINDRERLIANARDELDNTMVYLMEYPIGATDEDFSRIDLIPKTNEIDEFDHDSSIQFLNGNDTGGVDLLSFSHRGLRNTVQSLLIRDRLGIDEPQLLAKPPEIPKEEFRDSYRLLQLEPIFGKFLHPAHEEILMLSRGIDDKGKGEDYEKTVRGYFSSLNDIANIKSNPVIINLPEDSEPPAPVSLADGRTGLLSVLASKTLELELRDFKTCATSAPNTNCATVTSVAVPKSMDASWVRMPVQVLPSNEQENSSLLFFTRITCIPGEGGQPVICSELKAPDFPSTVIFDFEYHRLSKTDTYNPELQKIGAGSCSIELEKQRVQYRRKKDGKEIDGPLVSKISLALPEENRNNDKLNPLVFRDFADRWSASQVIPGRIFERDEVGAHQDLLDVAVIFKDYTGFSLLLKGQPMQGQSHRLVGFSPGYVSCGGDQ